MSRIVFGVDAPPTGKGPVMAYVGRNPSCGHVRAVLADRTPADAEEAAAWALDGLVVERIELKQARAEEGSCDVCFPAEPLALPL